MQNKPILESPHAISGLAGLGLLTVQAILPALFNGNNDLRTAHAFLVSGVGWGGGDRELAGMIGTCVPGERGGLGWQG